MTIKRLTKLGNSQALVLEKAILAQMGLAEAGEVQLTLHGRQLIVTPVDPQLPDGEFEASAERVLARYDELFRRLA